MRIGETDCELLLLVKLWNFGVLLGNRFLSLRCSMGWCVYLLCMISSWFTLILLH